MRIRPYEPGDKEDVRFICLNSEWPCDMDARGCHFILTTYCDYYIEKEPENCFVAVNDENRAVGYIICTENYDRFRPVFLREYVPRIPAEDPERREDAVNSTLLQEKFKALYPAHLHIDLLPEYQRMGLGHRLVDTLRAHLKEKNVPGVMLTVGGQNRVGQSFYKKYGFERLDETPGDVAFGIRT